MRKKKEMVDPFGVIDMTKSRIQYKEDGSMVFTDTLRDDLRYDACGIFPQSFSHPKFRNMNEGGEQMDRLSIQYVDEMKIYVSERISANENEYFNTFQIFPYDQSDSLCPNISQDEYREFCKRDTTMSRIIGAVCEDGKHIYYLERIQDAYVMTRLVCFFDVDPVQYVEKKMIFPSSLSKILSFEKGYVPFVIVKTIAEFHDFVLHRYGL